MLVLAICTILIAIALLHFMYNVHKRLQESNRSTLLIAEYSANNRMSIDNVQRNIRKIQTDLEYALEKISTQERRFEPRHTPFIALDETEKALAARKEKIQAIKALRQRIGCSLREGKDAIEVYQRTIGIPS